MGTENRKPGIIKKFRQLWLAYFLQSVLASFTIMVVVVAVGPEASVVIASMGATCFICFALPQSASARTRNVIGGHLVGLFSGAIFWFVGWPYWLEFSVVAGLAIFLMVVLDVEHAPAVGTALAVRMQQVDPRIAVTIMIGAVVISQTRYFLRRYLKDLL